MNPVIVIGSGLAGITTIREFRKLDAKTPVLLITADDGDFYSKPALSNALAQGKSAEQLVVTPAATLCESLNVTLLARTDVQGVRTTEHVVDTRHGALPYSKLVLALGADPIRLPLGGNAAQDVVSVNDIDDYRLFRNRLRAVRHVAILGGGLIGSEFANDLAGAGFAVTVIDPSPYPIAGLLPPAAGEVLRTALETQGVHWRLHRTVKNVESVVGGYLLTLDDGSQLQADLVLSAVGLRPRTALARDAGLTVNRGIVTDSTLRTSAPDVYAIGDCAETGGQVRPFVLPIMTAARALAQTLAGRAAEVVFPFMPVVIKTPACPLVVQPVARDAQGEWHTETASAGMRMLFTDADRRVQGMVLTGSRVSERAALARQLGLPLAT